MLASKSFFKRATDFNNIPFKNINYFKFYKCVSVQKVTVLFDLEGFNMRQYAWKPAAELVFTLLQIYEANYPEILKICFIFNGKSNFFLN